MSFASDFDSFTARLRRFFRAACSHSMPIEQDLKSESLAIYEESLWTWFLQKQKADAPKQNLLILTPPPNEAPHSSLVHMFETIRQKLGPAQVVYAGQVDHMGSWVLDSEMAIRFLSEIKNGNQAVLVLGTAFSYVHLLDTLAERRVGKECS